MIRGYKYTSLLNIFVHIFIAEKHKREKLVIQWTKQSAPYKKKSEQ